MPLPATAQAQRLKFEFPASMLKKKKSGEAVFLCVPSAGEAEAEAEGCQGFAGYLV